MHDNPEENHKDAFLLLFITMEQQRKTRLEAIEKEKSLQKNMELRLNKLKLRHIIALEVRHNW